VRARLLLALATTLAAGCAAGEAVPASIDTRNDACRQCRMAISNVRFAGQLVVPGEEPALFDDIGCLFTYITRSPSLPANATPFVADHRTGEWVRATSAVFTRAPGVETPMGSHLLAHANEASRDADPAARSGVAVRLDDLVPAAVRGSLR
jgi:copper chaperone NosL